MTKRPTLDELLEQAVIGNPDERIQKLKAEWEEAQKTERAVFERVCTEEYDRRLDYHRICQTPAPEGEARREVILCRPLWQEELDERLNLIWSGIVSRVSRVMEGIVDERRED